MRPFFEHSGYVTCDLTECHVHRVTEKDGSTKIKLCYPNKWTAGEPVEIMCVTGPMTIRQYRVTEWEMVDLQVGDKS